MPIPSTTTVDKFGRDCQTIMANLDRYICRATPANYQPDYALIGFDGFYRNEINAPYFRANLEPNVAKNGQLRSIDLYYLPEDCDPALDCATVDLCDGPDESGYDFISIDPETLSCSTFQVVMSPYDFERHCGDSFDELLAKKILQKSKQATVQMDNVLQQALIAGAGGNANLTGTPGEIEVFAATIGAQGLLNANVYHNLIESTRFNRIGDCPASVIFGYRNALNKIENVSRFGCCNEVGADQAQLSRLINEFRPFRARSVDANMTAAAVPAPEDTALLVHPGASHLVEYFRYETTQHRHGESYTTVWTNPRDGEQWDLKVHWVDCPDEKYVFTFSKRYKLIIMPTDLYCSDLAGVNGIWLLQFDQCPEAGC